MFINPFVAGVLATVLSELVLFVVVCVVYTIKSKKK